MNNYEHFIWELIALLYNTMCKEKYCVVLEKNKGMKHDGDHKMWSLLNRGLIVARLIQHTTLHTKFVELHNHKTHWNMGYGMTHLHIVCLFHPHNISWGQ